MIYFIIWLHHTHKKKNKIKDGIGGSYRLASLDRLATRQRILEQNGGYGAISSANSTTLTANADKKNGLHKVDGNVTNGSSSITHSVRPKNKNKLKPKLQTHGQNKNKNKMKTEHSETAEMTLDVTNQRRAWWSH